MDAYLDDEMNHGTMLSPFREPPINDLHISPFMIRDKLSSDKTSVIIDLSWPKGQSVNSGIDSDRYLWILFLPALP